VATAGVFENSASAGWRPVNHVRRFFDDDMKTAQKTVFRQQVFSKFITAPCTDPGSFFHYHYHTSDSALFPTAFDQPSFVGGRP
jgi:hypothetical protein